MSTENNPSGGMTTITICMGSSCFARGNQRTLEAVREFLRTRNIEAEVLLKGSLCEDLCREGPNMSINGKLYKGVDPDSADELLRRHFAGDEP